MPPDRPWRGLYTATALPFNDDLSVDYDSYAEHVAWLAASGTDGVCPNGSLGEYQTLSDEERARVVRTAAEARPAGFGLMPGVAAYGSRQTQRWIEQAAEAGAESVLLLPPNTYRADRGTVLDHYRAAAAVGLPIVAYNNPIDTKVDLTPDVFSTPASAVTTPMVRPGGVMAASIGSWTRLDSPTLTGQSRFHRALMAHHEATVAVMAQTPLPASSLAA